MPISPLSRHFNRHSWKFYALLLIALCASITPIAAQALESASPMAVDQRIRTIRYAPDQVYRFLGHYGYQSIIEFSKDEIIETVSMGDSTGWQINPAKNRIFLKPIAQNSLTNMTVITSARMYH